jgi:hypothetical protein
MLLHPFRNDRAESLQEIMLRGQSFKGGNVRLKSSTPVLKSNALGKDFFKYGNTSKILRLAFPERRATHSINRIIEDRRTHFREIFSRKFCDSFFLELDPQKWYKQAHPLVLSPKVSSVIAHRYPQA